MANATDASAIADDRATPNDDDDDANAVKWARDNLVDAKRGDCVHLLHILPRRTEAVAGYAYPMMGAPTRRGGRVSSRARALVPAAAAKARDD